MFPQFLLMALNDMPRKREVSKKDSTLERELNLVIEEIMAKRENGHKANIETKVEKAKLPKPKKSPEPEKERGIEEWIVRENYELMSRNYKLFMANYLNEQTSIKAAGYDYSWQSEKQEWKWGDELLSYKEREEIVRTVQMNALMGGPHNPVNPHHTELYERWKDISKFNLLYSFFMYDRMNGTG